MAHRRLNSFLMKSIFDEKIGAVHALLLIQRLTAAFQPFDVQRNGNAHFTYEQFLTTVINNIWVNTVLQDNICETQVRSLWLALFKLTSHKSTSSIKFQYYHWWIQIMRAKDFEPLTQLIILIYIIFTPGGQFVLNQEFKKIFVTVRPHLTWTRTS